MEDPTPAFVVLDHGGLIARFGPTSRDAGWWLFLTGMLFAWTGGLIAGTWLEGLSLTLLCMWAFVPFLGTIVVLFGAALGIRRELRLSADGVYVTEWTLGVPRRWRFDLRTLQVVPHHVCERTGQTHTALDLIGPVERVSVPLPGGLTLRERQEALDQLAWLACTLRSAALDLEDAPEDEEARRRLLDLKRTL